MFIKKDQKLACFCALSQNYQHPFEKYHLGTIHKSVKGRIDTKKKLPQNFLGPPFQTMKKISPLPFLWWKLQVNPIEKHLNSIFTGTFAVIFFKAPLTWVKQVFVNGPL